MRSHRPVDSVQCSEAAERTRSYVVSVVRSSSPPGLQVTSGTARRSSARICASGSVAVMSMPRERNARVALPVPAPISRAVRTGRPA